MKIEIKEKDLLKSIKDYLQYLENQKKLFYIRNNSGKIFSSYKGKNRMIAFGKKGTADIIIFMKGGRTIFIECKRNKGKITEAQKEFAEKIKMLGYEYYCITTFEQFEKILENNFALDLMPF